MLFNSYVFILLFFPLCMAGWFGLNHFKKYRLAQLFLFLMSLWFYGYFNPSYLPIILVSVGVNYAAGRLMAATGHPGLKKAELIAALLVNLGILFYFKYFDFFLENVNLVLGTGFPLRNILLPLGISFFTFQQVSYVIDAYRGEADRYDFLQYACFVVYFPQLIAGPIVTHNELIPQFADPEKKKFRWDNFSAGFFMFTLGMAKKVLIADTFGGAVNWGFANIPSLDSTNALLSMFCYTVQIYFDFSGYCDMAIGIGRMMNIELPVNFDSPYKALTITDFWSRWHKTLTRFFTKYLYIPLGGNRRGDLCTYRNVFIVFLVSGIWHGANWTFILWGALHGVFMVITRRYKRGFEAMPKALCWLITFVFLNVTWVLFRAESISDAAQLLSAIGRMEFGPVDGNIVGAFLMPEFELVMEFLLPHRHYVPMVIGVASVLPVMLLTKNAREHMLAFRPRLHNLVLTWILFVWCIMSLSGVSTFLYFNF